MKGKKKENFFKYLKKNTYKLHVFQFLVFYWMVFFIGGRKITRCKFYEAKYAKESNTKTHLFLHTLLFILYSIVKCITWRVII